MDIYLFRNWQVTDLTYLPCGLSSKLLWSSNVRREYSYLDCHIALLLIIRMSKVSIVFLSYKRFGLTIYRGTARREKLFQHFWGVISWPHSIIGELFYLFLIGYHQSLAFQF